MKYFLLWGLLLLHAAAQAEIVDPKSLGRTGSGTMMKFMIGKRDVLSSKLASSRGSSPHRSLFFVYSRRKQSKPDEQEEALLLRYVCLP